MAQDVVRTRAKDEHPVVHFSPYVGLEDVGTVQQVHEVGGVAASVGALPGEGRTVLGEGELSRGEREGECVVAVVPCVVRGEAGDAVTEDIDPDWIARPRSVAVQSHSHRAVEPRCTSSSIRGRQSCRSSVSWYIVPGRATAAWIPSLAAVSTAGGFSAARVHWEEGPGCGCIQVPVAADGP